MPSLHDLDSQMSHLKVSDDDMDDCSSQCSYYSLPDLERDPWLQKIPASEVRKQANLVPAAASPGVEYPHNFLNREKLPLKLSGPWVEYPLCLNGRYLGHTPGPARVIVNPSVPGGHDVIYHPRRDDKKFRQATYRSKGYKPYYLAKPEGCSPPDSPISSPPLSPGDHMGAAGLYPIGFPGATPVSPDFAEISCSQAMGTTASNQQYFQQNYYNYWPGHCPQTAAMMTSGWAEPTSYYTNQSYFPVYNSYSASGYY
ncbi:hypothetical protein FSARC_14669 [Fusarium sarcochroum]|uniref:Uncharacterized protein n=1 Tax=Fusarium sarcochroum TaxID=1208366 RepID=A0A8H4WN19_9HYPO|nr:hypothetical protein FSARC_14669 [Fusarium sarcochroum]